MKTEIEKLIDEYISIESDYKKYQKINNKREEIKKEIKELMKKENISLFFHSTTDTICDLSTNKRNKIDDELLRILISSFYNMFKEIEQNLNIINDNVKNLEIADKLKTVIKSINETSKDGMIKSNGYENEVTVKKSFEVLRINTK